jgi:hypothetical protein
MPNSRISEVVEHFEALPANLQEQILALLRVLDPLPRQGVAGKTLLAFAGTISTADLAAMSQAIEQGCEQVDLNEW